MTIDIRQIVNYNRLMNNERGLDMNICENCGKKMSVFDTHKIDGITLCYECATKAAEAKLRNGGKAVNVSYNASAENANSEKKSEATANANKAINNSVVQPVNREINTPVAARTVSPWIGYLKTIALVNIIVGIIASLAMGVFVYNVVDDGAFIFAAITVIAGIVISALFTALLMVFAEMAEDVSIIRHIINKKK